LPGWLRASAYRHQPTINSGLRSRHL